MSRLPQLPHAEIPEEAKPLFDFAQSLMGFTPNDVYDMARSPAILKGVAAMCGSIYSPDGKVDDGLKRLIGYVASTTAGCKYCQIHTAHGAHEQGVENDKILAAWDYESSPLFSDAERTAMRVANFGSMNPSEVTDEHFTEMRAHFSDEQVVEIVAVISMFGFLNRWNSIMDTTLEETPLRYTNKAGIKAR